MLCQWCGKDCVLSFCNIISDFKCFSQLVLKRQIVNAQPAVCINTERYSDLLIVLKPFESSNWWRNVQEIKWERNKLYQAHPPNLPSLQCHVCWQCLLLLVFDRILFLIVPVDMTVKRYLFILQVPPLLLLAVPPLAKVHAQ